MSYLGGRKLAWGNALSFETTPYNSPYLNYYKWNISYNNSNSYYTYAYAVTSSDQDIDYSSTTNNLYKRIWRESDVIDKWTADSSNMIGAYGVSGNSVPNQNANGDGIAVYVLQYAYNNSTCVLVGVRFALPFFYGHFSDLNISISSQNDSRFYFALLPSTGNPSGYKTIKTFNFTWGEYSSNSSTSYTSGSGTASQSGRWFMGKLCNALGQDIYSISKLSASDHTMVIRSGSNTNAYYILILYWIEFFYTFTGSARPSHYFLRVNSETNWGTAVNITNKTGGGNYYPLTVNYWKVQIDYGWEYAFLVNELNYLFSKRIDPY